jgi:hypothetical protein
MSKFSKSSRLRAIVFAGILGILIQPGAAMADGMASEGGVGALSAVSSLVYAPVKLVYSVLGLVFGGVAYGLSGGDSDVFSAVITPAVRGDYVVSPAVIRGERSLEFFGRDPEYRRMSVAAAPAVAPKPPVTEEDF